MKISATTIASESLSVIATNHILNGDSNIVAGSNNSGGLLDAVLHFPGFWSVCIMLVIVGLLVAWEESIELLRENTPPAIQPVIDKVLGEIGGLGFIGLVLSTFVLNQQLGLGHSVGGLSETYLGNEEILLETFEFLHQVFFQTAIVYFVSTAFVITKIVSEIYFITTLTEQKAAAVAACETGSSQDADLPIEAYEAFLRIEEGIVPSPSLDNGNESNQQFEKVPNNNNNNNNNNRWQRELGLTREERGAEILVIRERLKREGLVANESSFTIRSYLEDLFSSDKFEFVELSPLSWVPLIPGLALLSSVDLAHDVLPNSQNSYESCGYFVSTPWVILPIAASQILCLVWSVYNFNNMASIKTMLVPRVFRKEHNNGGDDCGFEIVRPDVAVPELRRAFRQSMASNTPVVFRPIESFYGSRPTNRIQVLFGTVGGNGKGYFLDSIKFQLWLTVSSIVCLGSEILTRDVLALVASSNNIAPGAASSVAGNPDSLVAETLVFGLFLVFNVLELLIVPTTFLNYCLIDTVETFVDQQGREATAVSVE